MSFENNWDARTAEEAMADVETWKRRLEKYRNSEYGIESVRRAERKLQEAEEILRQFEMRAAGRKAHQMAND